MRLPRRRASRDAPDQHAPRPPTRGEIAIIHLAGWSLLVSAVLWAMLG